MANKETQLGLQSILCQRANEDYDFSDLEPSTLAEFISQHCAIDLEKASALAWGEGGSLEADELSRISSCFSLHEQLLSALLFDSSTEVLDHILKQIVEESLNPSECPHCSELEDRIYQALETGGSEDYPALHLEVLTHVNGSPTDVRVELEDTELLESMLGVFRSLPRDKQVRVLGFACQESGSESERYSSFNTYAALRAKLNPLARTACDQLARSPSGSLTASELRTRLNLSDKRALGQLSRTVDRAVSALSGEGYERLGNPLSVEKTGKEKIFVLSPEAQRAWEALLRAEASAMLVIEDLA